ELKTAALQIRLILSISQDQWYGGRDSLRRSGASRTLAEHSQEPVTPIYEPLGHGLKVGMLL
ncbi:hypothetical protein LEMLEM_LOCUS13877, partial [Lemmus lemmus]